MSIVYVVHCVDTEGPLYESLAATFERLRTIFQIDLKPSQTLLAKLQRGQVDLGGIEKSVQKVLDPQLIKYNDTWDKIDNMLHEILSLDFRNAMLDRWGSGWIFNWFCVDHVDYDVNPRRRDIGYHNIFDHYCEMLSDTESSQDGLQFHYHPHAFVRHAHRSATHWWSASNSLYQVLSRRIIDRQWFPAVNRPGFQVNRPDSHWFLEQFIPFDLASLALDVNEEDEQQLDFSHGRSGDWRRAPNSWEPYHPSHDDYQIPGTCRRWIARCLNIGTRAYLLSEDSIYQAYSEAAEGKPTVVSFASHDFRDLRTDVNVVRQMLSKIDPQFPDVEFKFAESLEAMREALNLERAPRCNLDVQLESIGEYGHKLTVTSDYPTFGPQPYLAIKTVTNDYHHDNFDFQIPNRQWSYIFDEETFPIRAVETIGIATNNSYGVTTVTNLDTLTGSITHQHWGEHNSRELRV